MFFKGKKPGVFRNINEVEGRTLKIDIFKTSVEGFYDVAGWALLLTIAIQYYHMNDLGLSIVQASGTFAQILAFFFSGYFITIFKKYRVILPVLTFIISASFIILGIFNSQIVFILSSVLFFTCLNVRNTLYLTIYQENYQPQNRGRLFAMGQTSFALSVIIYATLIGVILDNNIALFRVVFIAFGVILIGVGFVLTKNIEPVVTKEHKKIGLIKSLKVFKTNPYFRKIILGFIILDIGVYAFLIMRVPFLSNPEGFYLSPLLLLFVTMILPYIVRVLSIGIWGRLFDRTNIPVFRITESVIALFGIIVFFFTTNFYAMVVACIVWGFATSGTSLVWGLWTVKVCKTNIQDYARLNLIIIGIRGTIVPFVAFYLLSFNLVVAFLLFLAFYLGGIIYFYKMIDENYEE